MPSPASPRAHAPAGIGVVVEGLLRLSILVVTHDHEFGLHAREESIARRGGGLHLALQSKARAEGVGARWHVQVREHEREFPVPGTQVQRIDIGNGDLIGVGGAELGHEQRMGMPVGDYLSIVQALPEARFEDAGDLIVRMRMVKTSEEVAYMREAAAVTGRARQRLFREIAPGMTERDAVRRLRQLILEEGGDRTSFVHLIAGEPACHSQHHLDRPLRKGHVLYVDAGAYVRFHTIDYARIATLGPASDAVRRGHEVLLEAIAMYERAGYEPTDRYNDNPYAHHWFAKRL